MTRCRRAQCSVKCMFCVCKNRKSPARSWGATADNLFLAQFAPINMFVTSLYNRTNNKHNRQTNKQMISQWGCRWGLRSMIRAGKCCREEYERFTSRWETAQRRCTRQNKYDERNTREEIGAVLWEMCSAGAQTTRLQEQTQK